jgi:hypothetical protein
VLQPIIEADDVVIGCSTAKTALPLGCDGGHHGAERGNGDDLIPHYTVTIPDDFTGRCCYDPAHLAGSWQPLTPTAK